MFESSDIVPHTLSSVSSLNTYRCFHVLYSRSFLDLVRIKLGSHSTYISYNSYIFGNSPIMSYFSLNFPIFLYFLQKGIFFLEKSYFPDNDDVKLSSRISLMNVKFVWMIAPRTGWSKSLGTSWKIFFFFLITKPNTLKLGHIISHNWVHIILNFHNSSFCYRGNI